MAGSRGRRSGASGTYVPQGGASPRGPGTLREWPAVLVLACVAASLISGTLFGERTATLMIGATCGLAAVLRMCLCEVGILAVRSRFTDVLVLLFLGTTVVLLGLSIPPAVVNLPLLPNRTG